MDQVRSKTGVPDAEDFRASDGASLVVNRATTTGKIYFLDDGDNVREAGDSLTTCTVSALTATTATVSALTAITATVSGTATFNGLIDASAAGAGQIKFPATQNASSNANTLDDYEEGTTTPTPTAAAGTFTTVAAEVNCTKIGRAVVFDCLVAITLNGTAAGYVIVPLPYTAADIAGMGGYKDTGVGLTSFVSGANLYIFRYDGAYPGADGVNLFVAGVFHV